VWGDISYFDVLAKATATINNSAFRGFKKGEVLFRGGQGRQVKPYHFEIDYNFAMRPNKSFHQIGSSVIVIPQELQSGWTHVDIEKTEVKEQTISGRKYKVEIPSLVRLHQVYEPSSFSNLGIFENVKLGISDGFGYIPWGQVEAKAPTVGYPEQIPFSQRSFP